MNKKMASANTTQSTPTLGASPGYALGGATKEAIILGSCNRKEKSEALVERWHF